MGAEGFFLELKAIKSPPVIESYNLNPLNFLRHLFQVLITPFTKEETEEQSSQVSCSRSHSW